MAPNSVQDLIVSASGIRGVVGRALTPEVAARYGAAFAQFLRRVGEPPSDARVVLGRDTRTSGALLADAVAAGLRSGGIAVWDAGVAPTPTLLLAAADDERMAGAAIVTASHNPAEWNGLKLAGADGRFLSPGAGRRVQEIFEAGPSRAGWDALGGREELAGAVDHHLERILGLSLVRPERIAARGFRVAVDCVHGAAAVALPRLLERLGCRVTGLGLAPDGRFPRDPEPTAANLAELGDLVTSEGADLGMAVDPDGDRLALVDGEGVAVGEDWTLALAVELVLAHRSGPVVTNLSSSRSIGDAAERAGQPLHRAPVGEAHVARRMAELGAVVGGEGNGGVMLPELHLTRDALLAAALVLQLLAERDASLGELLAAWPRYHISKRKARRPPPPLERAYEALLANAPAGAEEDRRDGLRLAWEDGRWVHVRPSGTEPVLRVVAEAPGAAEAERLTRWAEEILARAGRAVGTEAGGPEAAGREAGGKGRGGPAAAGGGAGEPDGATGA